MFALFQCGFSSAWEDNIPVPVNPVIKDETDFPFVSVRYLKTSNTKCILRTVWLTYLFLFGATPLSSLVGVYFGTWNHRSLCCGSTSHLKIIETNISQYHQAQHGRPLLAHHRGPWGMKRTVPAAWSANDMHSESDQEDEWMTYSA